MNGFHMQTEQFELNIETIASICLSQISFIVKMIWKNVIFNHLISYLIRLCSKKKQKNSWFKKVDK